MAPEFDGTKAMRYMPEDAAASDNVGQPVAAKDPGDTLSYMLGGADAGSFDIELLTGQIMVGADAELDHESKPTHTVTVTATDSHNTTDTITVTIHVTDVDEAPEDPAMDYVKGVEYAEDRTDGVITLAAPDPEGVAPIVWSLLTNGRRQSGHTR